MRRQDGGVLNLATAAVDRRHAEAHARTSLVATLSDATVRRTWALEVHEIAPNDELAGGVTRLRRRWWWGLAAPLALWGRRVRPGHSGTEQNRSPGG
jgi:hypothetical protein